MEMFREGIQQACQNLTWELVLGFSCHADPEGNLILKDGKLKFADIMQMLHQYFKGYRVVFYFDCCYAGKLVDDAEEWYQHGNKPGFDVEMHALADSVTQAKWGEGRKAYGVDVFWNQKIREIINHGYSYGYQFRWWSQDGGLLSSY